MLTSTRIDDALFRLKGLFLEAPRTALSIHEASAVAKLDETTCRLLLLALVEVRFLRRSPAGGFTLRGDDSRSAEY